ncbi:hypothetical protein X767_03630 [Mesorhizobium sp. LSJC264A00]|nr:hypothetical protein X767_03630 [Mesorhizobium sp. LSJC264A00]
MLRALAQVDLPYVATTHQNGGKDMVHDIPLNLTRDDFSGSRVAANQLRASAVPAGDVLRCFRSRDISQPL